MQVLRHVGAHARAEARRPSRSLRASVVVHRHEAGAPGFEPGITGPKPVALPLGHAPEPGHLASLSRRVHRVREPGPRPSAESSRGCAVCGLERLEEAVDGRPGAADVGAERAERSGARRRAARRRGRSAGAREVARALDPASASTRGRRAAPRSRPRPTARRRRGRRPRSTPSSAPSGRARSTT